MLDSINVGMSGLLGFSRGLRVIGNNTANMNTPGYKSATLQFTDLFYANQANGTEGRTQLGQGLGTAGTTLDFRAADLRQSGNEFDLGIDGGGFFVLRDEQGRTRYTRAGQFDFDQEGRFINRIDGSQVMGLDAGGNLVAISIAGMRAIGGQATRNVRFTGNLSATTPEQTVGSVKVYDAMGGEHTLSVKFTNTGTTTPGSWKVQLLDGSSVVGTTQMVFVDGRPTAATSKFAFTYTPAGRESQELTLDFSSDVTSFASGSLSTLAMTSQDGSPPGQLTKVTFDSQGTLVATYSNNRTARGARLALARFDTTDAVEDLGSNQFGEANGIAWKLGYAGDGVFGSVKAGVLEVSNVDLSREFSELVVMQRGYQASSQVVSTANEMLQELFQMKGGK
ncbi:flagellar hook protein FlgE [Ramlibacter humi]|uniref:Flagellar hook protein FlgE n=1 Tax=Ramlibacter humi TaxID=2530451 RepID=A0A4Z0BCT2_9BURK|nr:flagellar hook-basal body complex protein [Ramlibacter humi]TFY97076.1 flagellar hook-basal body complex protein [Ramlibacter humi]